MKYEWLSFEVNESFGSLGTLQSTHNVVRTNFSMNTKQPFASLALVTLSALCCFKEESNPTRAG